MMIGDYRFSVLLRPTTHPQLITVAGEKGNAPAPFVMNLGNWTITIKTTKEVMIVSHQIIITRIKTIYFHSFTNTDPLHV